MRFYQYVGPFSRGTVLPTSEDQEEIPDGTNLKYKYVQISIEMPHSFPLWEYLDFDELEDLKFTSHNLESGVKISIDGKIFIINENEVLEFEGYYESIPQTITILQDIDEYCIISIKWLNTDEDVLEQ